MNHVAPGSVLKFIRILCTASLGRTQFSIIHKKNVLPVEPYEAAAAVSRIENL